MSLSKYSNKKLAISEISCSFVTKVHFFKHITTLSLLLNDPINLLPNQFFSHIGFVSKIACGLNGSKKELLTFFVVVFHKN